MRHVKDLPDELTVARQESVLRRNGQFESRSRISRYPCPRDAPKVAGWRPGDAVARLRALAASLLEESTMDGPLSTMSRDALAARVGSEMGVSDWFSIGQEQIDAFAQLTHDHYFIHVDR